MSNIVPLSPTRQRFREASDWVTKLDRGLTAHEKEQLEQWFERSEENRELFLQVARQWDGLNELSRLADLFDEPAMRKRKRSRRGLLATAAAVVLAVAFGFLMMPTYFSQDQQRSPSNSAAVSVYETAVGEQSAVILADGSRVTLNTNSRLSVRFTTFHRKLILDRGEIHVDVANDASRPLTVFAGNKMFQALGTSFGVEIRNAKQVELVVTEGKVLVALRSPASVESDDPQAPVLPATSLTVTQGEEVHLDDHVQSVVTQVSLEEISVKLAWRDGDLVFRGEPLGVALAEVSRYTTVEFVFLSEDLREERIIGRFKTGDIEGLLNALHKNLGVAYERTDDGRVLLSSR